MFDFEQELQKLIKFLLCAMCNQFPYQNLIFIQFPLNHCEYDANTQKKHVLRPKAKAMVKWEIQFFDHIYWHLWGQYQPYHQFVHAYRAFIMNMKHIYKNVNIHRHTTINWPWRNIRAAPPMVLWTKFCTLIAY